NEEIISFVVPAAESEQRDGSRRRYTQHSMKWQLKRIETLNLVEEPRGLPIGRNDHRAGKSGGRSVEFGQFKSDCGRSCGAIRHCQTGLNGTGCFGI